MALSVVGTPFSPSNNTPPPRYFVAPDNPGASAHTIRDTVGPAGPAAPESACTMAALAAFGSDIPACVPASVLPANDEMPLVPVALGSGIAH
jgi:hypothetical protein